MIPPATVLHIATGTLLAEADATPLSKHTCKPPDWCICTPSAKHDLCPRHGYQHLYCNCVICGRKMKRTEWRR